MINMLQIKNEIIFLFTCGIKLSHLTERIVMVGKKSKIAIEKNIIKAQIFRNVHFTFLE